MENPPSFLPQSNRNRPRAEGAHGAPGELAGKRKSVLPPQRKVVRTPTRQGSAFARSQLPASQRQRPSLGPSAKASNQEGAKLLPSQSPATPPSVLNPPKKNRKKLKITAAIVVAAVLISLIAWPIHLINYGNSLLRHAQELPAGENLDDSGTTYLFTGSDQRGLDGGSDDGVQGARTDSIMLFHIAANGQVAVVSLPRDTLVTLPSTGKKSKLNAAFSYGGETLLTQTVQELSGLKVDHYVQVSMGGLTNLVDAVGGINFCLDQDVNDADSGLDWKAGCHDVDGKTALALSRMRNEDRLGDFGRAGRQREIIDAIVHKAADPHTLIWPSTQKELMGAGASSLITDPDTGVVDLAYMAWKFRGVKENGLSGIPPIAKMNNFVPGLGSTVLLDEDRCAEFWSKLSQGTLTKSDYNEFG